MGGRTQSNKPAVVQTALEEACQARERRVCARTENRSSSQEFKKQENDQRARVLVSVVIQQRFDYVFVDQAK